MKDTCNPLKDEFDKIIKLSDFLKENNAYDEFVESFDLSYYEKLAFSPKENVNFINAFSWSWCKLGDNFDCWYNLSNKWDELEHVSYDMDWLIHGKKIDSPKNNFKDYGFTADIDGEILKEIDNQYIEKKDS